MQNASFSFYNLFSVFKSKYQKNVNVISMTFEDGVIMHFVKELINNSIFMAAVWGWLVAQITKLILHLLLTGCFSPERLIGSGGMPSSHAATVSALATATYMKFGASGCEFAISLLFAIIVMYDAVGVRRETGIQAKLLNDIIVIFEDMERPEITEYEKLKELVGHTPFQVLIGALLGIVVGVLYSI